jgi:hypothetical protein
MSVSAVWSGTIVTSAHRDHFSREAKKWTRRVLRSLNATSTWPKSCCENSPGSPSKRISTATSRGRSEAITSYSALLPPP